jgi:hypothetical protein
VSSAKRFLAKPEYRIQLDELLAEETSRLLERLDAPEFAAQGNFGPAEFQARVQRYEAATEALARVAGVLGRWGDGRELGLVTDIIRSLYSHAEKVRAGLTVYLGMRSYPAVLVFTAYGLGLTRAARWPALHQFFSTTVPREYNDPKRAVELLHLTAWEGGDNRLWQMLGGYDRRKTALSDRLLEIFAEWGKSFAGSGPDFELLLERFELLGSLAHFEKNGKADIQQSLSGGDRNAWTWMPAGREAWHEKNQRILIEELQAEPTKSALLKAGFAQSEGEFLDLFIQNFRYIAGRMSWM